MDNEPGGPGDTSGKLPQGNFTVSHAKRIRFADGKVLELNRAERRRRKIYNRDLVKVR